MTRNKPRIFLALSCAVVLMIALVITVIAASHPSPPPINHCSGLDAANRWCIR